MSLDILIVDTKADLNLYKQSSYLGRSSCCGPDGARKEWPTEYTEMDFNEWVGKFFSKSVMIRRGH